MVYEHKVMYGNELGTSHGRDNDALAAELDKMSKDGWELVTTDGNVWVFKRPVQEED